MMERQYYTNIPAALEPLTQVEREAQPSERSEAASAVGPVYTAVKRLVDIVLSLAALILLTPVLLLLAFLVRRDSPGHAFHRRRVLEQQDYRGGSLRTFDAFKFRTMIPNADEYLERHPELLRQYTQDYKLHGADPRITRLGARLRQSSLDELPQLLNVLRGQMTLVGPRMITPPELEKYGEHAAKLLSVKPGLTGLWQVSGRQHVPYHERVRLDMWYIDNRSLLLDLEILLRTVRCVLLREGAY